MKKQINAGLEDVGADVVKLGRCYLLIVLGGCWLIGVLGMLSSTETIHVIADALESHKVPAVVLDPVLFASQS